MSALLRIAIDNNSYLPGEDRFSGRDSLTWGLFDEHKKSLQNQGVPFTGDYLDYREDGLEITNDDPYGDQLQFMSAESLYEALKDHAKSPWQKGILALLESIEPDQRIMIYWE